MKTAQRILLSLIFSVVIFTVIISLSFTDLIPAYTALIENLYLNQPKSIFILILSGAFLVLFLIVFLGFSLGSRKTKAIREKIQKESDSLFNELLAKLPLISLTELQKQLNYSKVRFAGELKMQYCKKSLRYVKLIDETIESRWLQLESLLEAQKRVELESDETEGDEQLLSEVDETVLNSIQTGIENQNSILPEKQLEVSEQSESINPLEIIEDLESVEENAVSTEDNIDLLEELESTESAENSQIDEIEELEELEELEEIDDLEELESIDETDSSKIHDPYPELLSMLNKRPIYIATSNKTFISAETDDFATVDNIFAEDLCLGTEYTCSYAPFDEKFTFIPVQLDLQVSSEPGKLLPLQDSGSFSMTGFCSEKKISAELSSDSNLAADSAIVEKDGVYSISDNVSYQNVVQDSSLKELVESILK
jgi:hypothetical protein